MALVTRRSALVLPAVGLSACGRLGPDALTRDAAFRHVLAHAEAWNLAAQRLLLSGGALARTYPASAISPVFKANGTLDPGGPAYEASRARGFADWRLAIDGLVARPYALSVAQIRALPQRTQITRHDCVEGWSAIGGWTGVQLGLLLTAARLLPTARYAVFFCADNLDGEPAKGGEQGPGQYYESLDLTDAFHPQTLIAWAMNGRTLDTPHGAPLRLRVERQLGYKSAKYVQRIHLVDSLAGINGGKGGYWEDRGYEWYAGI